MMVSWIWRPTWLRWIKAPPICLGLEKYDLKSLTIR